MAGNSSEMHISMQFSDANRYSIAMYSVLILASAVGNLSAFVSLIRLRRRRKLGAVSLLLLNLAVADLFVTFLTMPIEVGWNITVSWKASDWACRVISFIRSFGMYASSFIIVCICLDRYYAVMKPMAVAENHSRGKRFLVVAWICSFVSSLPQSIIFHVDTHPDFPWYKQCVTFNFFKSTASELAYNLFVFSCMYVIPMTTITVTYSIILWKMHSISKNKKSQSNRRSLRRSSLAVIERAKQNTLKMSIFTALGFTICWTPYNVMSLWYFFDKKSASQVDWRIQKFLFVFASSNSCLNPLIYGWYHVTKATRSEVKFHPVVESKQVSKRRQSCPESKTSCPKRRESVVRFSQVRVQTNIATKQFLGVITQSNLTGRKFFYKYQQKKQLNSRRWSNDPIKLARLASILPKSATVSF